MFLRSISIVNFKNYAKAAWQFDVHINCFTGPNGIGKTNLLDAIYYLCLTKSYFNASDLYNVKHGEDFFRLEGAIEKERVDNSGPVVSFDHAKDDSAAQCDKPRLHHLKCIFQKGKRKEFFKDEVKYERLSEHVGQFPVVIITPDDNLLIGGGSEERRRFMDNLLSQIDHQYLANLQSYLKVLEQRNALLKRFADMQFFDAEMVSAYDVKLVEYGAYIHSKRKQITTEIGPVFNDIYKVLSEAKETVKITYESDLNHQPLQALLAADIERDRLLKRTGSGIHRDDLLFEMDGYATRRFGSQGQQKSFLLSLKLAQYRLLQQYSGIAPLLLLDDIFDKLDVHRSTQLLDYLCTRYFGQIFITDTQPERLEQYFKEHREKVRMVVIEVSRDNQKSLG